MTIGHCASKSINSGTCPRENKTTLLLFWVWDQRLVRKPTGLRRSVYERRQNNVQHCSGFCFSFATSMVVTHRYNDTGVPCHARYVSVAPTGVWHVFEIVLCSRCFAPLSCRVLPPCILFVKNHISGMHMWMGAVDCVVTKAGPGIIAEAMIQGLPIMLSACFPGQVRGAGARSFSFVPLSYIHLYVRRVEC